MPTYEYTCDACGVQFEREQGISEAPIKKCPKCGKLKARRMISAGNFILKGGGWYSDLYSGPSNRKGSSASEASSSSETKSESTTESKPKPEKSAKKAAAG